MASTSPDPEKTPYADPPQAHGADDITPAAKHLDDNYELYKSARDLDASPEEIKAVLRKIDLRIIPILFVTYMLQYLDKNSINFSSVYGLQKGTHLNSKSQQFSWLGMSFSSPSLLSTPLLSTSLFGF